MCSKMNNKINKQKHYNYINKNKITTTFFIINNKIITKTYQLIYLHSTKQFYQINFTNKNITIQKLS